MDAPDPNELHPIPNQPRVVLLKPLVTSELIEVGEYSYYDDPEFALEFEERNVLYSYGPDRLVIGKFCSIATGVRFLMNGANHRMSGPSTFPFPIIGEPWSEHVDLIQDLPNAGDTVVGNDVWIGRDALIMPGTRLGHGSVIASGAVVSGTVEPYSIVGGNPSRLIRKRFSDEEIQLLLEVSWWDWPIAKITENIRLLMAGGATDLLDA